MRLVSLIVKEARLRWGNFLLSLLAIVAAVAAFVTLLTMGEALRKETAQIVRDLGFNILILPKEADPAQFWIEGYVDKTMPEEYVDRLAGTPGLYADHFVGILQWRIKVKGKDFLLVGWLPERRSVDYLRMKKRPMGYRIPPRTALVGSEVARALGLKEGQTFELLGHRLKVARCLKETGGRTDISIYVPLSEAQAMLGMPGRINIIRALNCLCIVGGKLQNPLRLTISKIEGALPGVRAIPLESIAEIRHRQRLTVDKWVAAVLPVMLIICAAWVGALSLLNVNQRREEVGLLRALGFGSWRIAALLLGRAALLGFLGAAVGFAVGTWLALHFGPGIFKITAAKLKPSWSLLLWSLVGAPLLAVVASFVPTAIAVAQDPAEVLARG